MVMGRIGQGPKWLFADMTHNLKIYCAGSLLYNGNMIQMLVIFGTSDYCHR